jgi:NADH-quinone oxidoreductase subunit N
MSVLPVIVAQVGQVPMPGSEGAGTELTSGHTTGPSVAPDVIWAALLPLIVLAVGAVLLLTISSLIKVRAGEGGSGRRLVPSRVWAIYTVVVAAVSMVSALPLWARVQGWDHLFWWDLDLATKGPYTTFGSTCTVAGQAVVEPSCGVIGVDGFSVAVTMVIGAAVILGALLASDYLRRERLEGPELYVLLLLSGAGGVVMAMANDLIVLFLGLETLSIAGYVLTALHLRRLQSQEAAIKYFVLGAFASAFFLYGIAMIYGATGTTNLVSIRNVLSERVFAPVPAEGVLDVTMTAPLLLLGLGFMLVGLGFKVAAVPFHFWSPDVYDGAPTPVVAYMASGFKAAGFAALVRVFVVGFGAYTTSWRPIVATLAVLSMVIGALLAVVQVNVKRTLAYSSINHAGFILMALQASSDEGNRAVLFYLVAYTFMVAGSFGVATVVARRGDGRVSLDDYRGLSRSSPGLALVFTVFLLAQAGVPFTSGFVAKLYTVLAAVEGGATWLGIVGMVSSVVAAYLYLRIIVSMYMAPPADAEAPAVRVPAGARAALALCLIVTIGVGLVPGTLTRVAGDARPVLVNLPEPPGSPTQEPSGGIQLGAGEGSPAAPR